MIYQTPYDDNILGRGDKRGGDARRQDPGPGWVGPGRRVAGQEVCGHCWSVMPGLQQKNVFFKNIELS
jgi:hypothetical protein